jgi:hypothetical protein
MGDRCYVELTVLTEQLPQVMHITKVEDYAPCETREEDDATVLCFEEVNYGTIPWLGQLTDLGIAWDSRWHGGDEYGPGRKQTRFAPDGTVQELEYCDTEEGVIDTSKLLEFMNTLGVTVDSIRNYILDHVRSFDPLPWEGQIEFGKRHLALKLIGGT